MAPKDYIKLNEIAWNKRAENNDEWSQPVSSEIIEAAKNGNWSIVLTPSKKVPADWFPSDLKGKKVLCLAGGGGQQGPVLAAAGADVTVYDNSDGQLELENSIPYADIDHLDNEFIREITEAEGLCWGHPIENQIQGQISAGFAIIGFYEDIGHWLFNDYINTSMATKAIKIREIPDTGIKTLANIKQEEILSALRETREEN